MNVSGTWEGEYEFAAPEVADEESGEKTETGHAMGGKVVAFTMELHQGWLGAVNGTVQDDARSGFLEAGKIKGKIKGHALEFRKLMPVLRLIHESGWVTLEKWAERRKIVMDIERPAPALLHEGTLSADGKLIEGEWRMPPTTIEVPGSYLNLVIPEMRGTWRMRRKS